jgi:DNA polymerase-3 subunit delta
VGKTLQKYRKLFETVKKGAVHPVYFLYGPEEYLKKEFIRELLDAALPDGNRAFNLDVLYGDEFDMPVFEDRVGSFPLFTERRVVILRNFKDLSNAHKDHVIDALGRVPESVVLVVETPNEKLDTVRLKNMKKAADARGSSFAFSFLDEDETIERARARFKREGYEVDPDALELLVESVGTKLIDLINEVEKISLAAGDRKSVDRELVAAVVGKYRTESLFSLLDAMGKRDPGEMIRLLNRLVDGGEEPVVVVGMLLRRVVLMLEVQAIVAENGRSAATGRTLAGLMSAGISPWYADTLGRQALGFERSELELLLTNLRWADFKVKTSALAPKHLVEEALMASHLGKTLAYAGSSL